MTIESIEDEAAGVDRTTKKVIAWHLDGIEGVGRFQDARVVMRVVAVKAEPVPKAQLAREIAAAGAREGRPRSRGRRGERKRRQRVEQRECQTSCWPRHAHRHSG